MKIKYLLLIAAGLMTAVLIKSVPEPDLRKAELKEADIAWEKTYGHMNEQQLAAGIVLEPEGAK